MAVSSIRDFPPALRKESKKFNCVRPRSSCQNFRAGEFGQPSFRGKRTTRAVRMTVSSPNVIEIKP